MVALCIAALCGCRGDGMTRITGWTEADVAKHQAKVKTPSKEHMTLEEYDTVANPGRSPRKYGNQPTTDEYGRRVDSKLEAKHVMQFRQRLKAHDIKLYARQPEIMLPGGVKMVPDHLVIELDGTVVLYDSKGAIRQDWKNKQKQAKECLGFDVLVLK